MIVHGCLKNTVIELLLLFVLLFLTHWHWLFVFMYCIFLAIWLPCFNKLELSWVELRCYCCEASPCFCWYVDMRWCSVAGTRIQPIVHHSQTSRVTWKNICPSIRLTRILRARRTNLVARRRRTGRAMTWKWETLDQEGACKRTTTWHCVNPFQLEDISHHPTRSCCPQRCKFVATWHLTKNGFTVYQSIRNSEGN